MEGAGAVGLEDGSVSLVTGPGSSPEDGELELGVSELDGPGSPDLVLLVEDDSLDDGDGVRGGSVVTGHLSVELADGSIERDISVLFVHVVVVSPGLISEDDSECFDMVGFPLEDLVDGKDLSLSPLGLELSTQVVPELCFGNNSVTGEESDGIYFGVGVLVGGQFASKNEVLSYLCDINRYTFIWRDGSAGS